MKAEINEIKKTEVELMGAAQKIYERFKAYVSSGMTEDHAVEKLSGEVIAEAEERNS